MYLFAAYSIKDDVSEGLTGEQVVLVRKWAREILFIAHDEMAHLGMVNNLLTAVGALPHFDKPAFPAPHPFFETPELEEKEMNPLQKRRYNVLTEVMRKLDQDVGNIFEEFVHFFEKMFNSEHDQDDFLISVELQRFSILTLRRFIRAEATEHVSSDIVRTKLETMRRNGEPRSNSALDGLTAQSFTYNDVGELYEIIRDGFHYLAGEMGEENLFLGPKITQVSGGFKKPDVQPVASVAEVDRMIDVIIWQGAGAPTPPPDWYVDPAKKNHFKTFTVMYEQYKNELEKDPSFDPSRHVLRNPYVTTLKDRNPDWPSYQVTEPFAAGMMSLFNGCFEVTCQLLHLVFGASYADTRSRDITNIWQKLIFFPFMTQVLAPLGKILPKVPSGIKDSTGQMRMLGASFETSGQLASYNEQVYFPVILFRLEKFEEAALELKAMAEQRSDISSDVADDLYNFAQDVALVKNSLINSFANPTVPVPGFWGPREPAKAPLSLTKGFIKEDGKKTTAREACSRFVKLRTERDITSSDPGIFKTIDNARMMMPRSSLFAIQPKGEVTKENARNFLPDPNSGCLPFMPLPFREGQKVNPFEVPMSVLTCKFEGTMMFRLATDPDHSRDRRGKSGTTFTLPGEPNFVQGKNAAVVYWGRVDPEYIRTLGYDIKVQITDVVHTTQNGLVSNHDRDTAQELVGAELNLLAEEINGEMVPPTFRGTNGLVSDVGDESIDPFVLEITKRTDKGDIQIVKHDLLDPTNPTKMTQADADVNDKFTWFKRGPNWLSNDPTLIQHSGIYDTLGFNFQKAKELEAMAAEEKDPSIRANYLFRASLINNMQSPVVFVKCGWNWMSQFHISSGDPKWNTENQYSYVSPDTTKALGGEVIKEYDWFIRYWVGGYDSDAYTGRVFGELVIPFRKSAQ